MANISIKPVEPLHIEFNDGKTLTALFNNAAFLIYTDEFGDISEDMKESVMEKPYEFGAKLLYCGLKSSNPFITLEEAQTIMYMGGEALFGEILRLMIDNFMKSSNDETKKKFQKILDQELMDIEQIIQNKTN